MIEGKNALGNICDSGFLLTARCPCSVTRNQGSTDIVTQRTIAPFIKDNAEPESKSHYSASRGLRDGQRA
jgi:hypothetical protein